MQEKHEFRLLFLKQFTKELIMQSRVMEIEKVEGKKEFEIMVPSKTPEIKQELKLEYRTGIISKPKLRYRLKTVGTPIMPQTRQISRTTSIQGMQPSVISQALEYPKKSFEVVPQATGKIIELKKLNFLVKDPRVTIIECPGPNKFILARTAGQTRVTKISLSQDEIQETIDIFSREARVPVISGLFKAAVGDLVITAVISELVGSRFIINKLTPRFMMEQSTELY